MDYPKRGKTHHVEAESRRIFEQVRPENWIVRQTTERDYGIDAYVELVTRKDEISGEIFFVQLKGTKAIEWSPDGTFSFPGISRKTINYWLGLPVPVFLIVADLEAATTYFCPIKDCVRRQHAEFRKRQSLRFPLLRTNDLRTPPGRIVFLMRYFQEKWFATFENHARDLIMRWRDYREFILSYQGLDFFLGVEPEEQLVLQHLYAVLRFLANYVGVEWNVTELSELYRRDISKWKETFYRLHNESLDKVLGEIQQVFPEIVRRTARMVGGEARDYWRSRNPILAQFAENLLLSDSILEMKLD